MARLHPSPKPITRSASARALAALLAISPCLLRAPGVGAAERPPAKEVPEIEMTVPPSPPPKSAASPAPSGAAPGPVATLDAAGRGEWVARTFATGSLEELFEAFSPTMRQAIPLEKLAELRSSLRAQVGAFVSHEKGEVTQVEDHQVVNVRCRFEATELVTRAAFLPSGEIDGLFFSPAPPRQAWTPPSYVRPDSFETLEVTTGAEGWPLPGTLLTPRGAGPFPALVLLHGSGPNDRDESVGATKMFRDLAEGLASRGIAVLRYDKRTRVHGARLGPTLTVQDEVTEDALASLALLRTTPGVDRTRLFVLGHSLGAMMAPEVARRDPAVAGLVLLAGAARPLDAVIHEQVAYLLETQASSAEIRQTQMSATDKELAKLRTPRPAGGGDDATMVLGGSMAYWRHLLAYDPLAIAKKLKTPILLLQGERDYQVTMTDFSLWKEALAARKGVTFRSYPALNHLFVPGEGPSLPAEYETPGHVDGAVVADVAAWILPEQAPKPKTPKP